MAQVEVSNFVAAKIYLPQPIGPGRAQSHRIPTKGLTETKLATVKTDPTLVLNFPDPVFRTVLNGGQDLGKGLRADLITTSRHRQTQS